MHLKGGDKMRYAILGGDMRFAHLTRMLQESGRQAAGFLQEGAGGDPHPIEALADYSCIISNWPMRWPLTEAKVKPEEIMASIASGSVLLLCGPQFPANRRWDLQYINLWQDETLLRENAYLTAQAAVAAVMRQARMFTLGACMVIGYGRIGRALTEILLNLGAQVTVVSRKESKRRQAAEIGAQSCEPMQIESALPNQQIIFSTPPAEVLNADQLKRISNHALLIDLASAPYGFDLEIAQKMGLHAARESGLPGRYCPLSAARAIYNAVLRWEEANIHEN